MNEWLQLCITSLYFINIKSQKNGAFIEDKVVLVTSAASAIGVAVALSYAANGASVVVFDIKDNGTAEGRYEIIHI